MEIICEWRHAHYEYKQLKCLQRRAISSTRLILILSTSWSCPWNASFGVQQCLHERNIGSQFSALDHLLTITLTHSLPTRHWCPPPRRAGCASRLGSQFFLTLAEQLEYLDGEHCVFGQVVEGLDVLVKLNAAICDDKHQPYQDIRSAKRQWTRGQCATRCYITSRIGFVAERGIRCRL